MEFKEEEVVTKKSTIDVQSGEVHKVFEKDNTVSVVFQEEKNDVLIKCVLNLTKDDHKVLAAGVVTIDVTGGTEGDSHVVRIENTGIATVGFATHFLFPSGGTPALPTTSESINIISFTVHKAGAAGTSLLTGVSVNFS